MNRIELLPDEVINVELIKYLSTFGIRSLMATDKNIHSKLITLIRKRSEEHDIYEFMEHNRHQYIGNPTLFKMLKNRYYQIWEYIRKDLYVNREEEKMDKMIDYKLDMNKMYYYDGSVRDKVQCKLCDVVIKKSYVQKHRKTLKHMQAWREGKKKILRDIELSYDELESGVKLIGGIIGGIERWHNINEYYNNKYNEEYSSTLTDSSSEDSSDNS